MFLFTMDVKYYFYWGSGEVITVLPAFVLSYEIYCFPDTLYTIVNMNGQVLINKYIF